MVAQTDPHIFRLTQNKPRLIMMMLQSQEEEEQVVQMQPAEDMDSNVPTIMMPPADFDIIDPLLLDPFPDTPLEIMEIGDDSDLDVDGAVGQLRAIDAAETSELVEYKGEDDVMDMNGHNIPLD
ncbi:hypothetical protein AWZ03_013753 [Drosophila navojoa]|uniref:Uncharacterized protein n=1 Tax=Drosophila navojoa TaxID=7232 RepID=A0A484ATY8_DRONA|nr:hypothetical protein AWZ03_013753 [Drosophila navojoa]